MEESKRKELLLKILLEGVKKNTSKNPENPIIAAEYIGKKGEYRVVTSPKEEDIQLILLREKMKGTNNIYGFYCYAKWLDDKTLQKLEKSGFMPLKRIEKQNEEDVVQKLDLIVDTRQKLSLSFLRKVLQYYYGDPNQDTQEYTEFFKMGKNKTLQVISSKNSKEGLIKLQQMLECLGYTTQMDNKQLKLDIYFEEPKKEVTKKDLDEMYGEYMQMKNNRGLISRLKQWWEKVQAEAEEYMYAPYDDDEYYDREDDERDD